LLHLNTYALEAILVHLFGVILFVDHCKY